MNNETPKSNSLGVELDALDLSVVRCDLGPEVFRPGLVRSGFWYLAYADDNMALIPRKLLSEVHIEKPVSIDFNLFSDKIFELHQMELESSAKPATMERPGEVDDQIVECTPQFILRNIPKIERYYDLDRATVFDIEDMPAVEAREQIDEVRNARVGDIEYIEVESINFIHDFRAFLEEIFYLCPWDQITKQEPGEDNPWHIKNSHAKLAQDLLSRKNKLFIFTEKGMTQIGMKDYKPRKEKNEPTEARPGFVHSYGPG